MTEDEARQKWCPFVRAADSLDFRAPAANRTAGPDEEQNPTWSKCIASDCMAWRWVGSDKTGDPPTFSTDADENRKRIKGYCGLAGKP